jgi:hypothetical protein
MYIATIIKMPKFKIYDIKFSIFIFKIKYVNDKNINTTKIFIKNNIIPIFEDNFKTLITIKDGTAKYS